MVQSAEFCPCITQVFWAEVPCTVSEEDGVYERKEAGDGFVGCAKPTLKERLLAECEADGVTGRIRERGEFIDSKEPEPYGVAGDCPVDKKSNHSAPGGPFPFGFMGGFVGYCGGLILKLISWVFECWVG